MTSSIDRGCKSIVLAPSWPFARLQRTTKEDKVFGLLYPPAVAIKQRSIPRNLSLKVWIDLAKIGGDPHKRSGRELDVIAECTL
jgi:hypothetical protein